MTSGKISQLASIMRSQELVSAQKNGQQDNGPVFGALLNQAPSGGKQNEVAWNGLGTPKAGMPNQDAFVKEASNSAYRGSPISQTGSTDIQEKLPEDAPEKLNEFWGKVTEAVAEELGVTEEEVKEAMEALGLTVLDLMDPSKLAGLVMELTGSEDIGSLLISEDFQQILGEIGELSQEFLSQLDVTPEELPQFKEQLEAMAAQQGETPALAETPVQENMQPEEEVSLPAQGTEETGQAPEAVKAQETAGTVAAQTSGQEVKEKPAQEQAEIANGAAEPEDGEVQEGRPVQAATEAERQENPEESAKEGADGKSLQETAEGPKHAKEPESPAQSHVTYQTTAQAVNQGQAVEVTQTIVQTRIDVEDIMRQVSQMTRVMVSQAESSIEMQLNPANLGKVYLQVVSREGVITAQLAAQNEAVKEALENQVAILKENMNQQGIKVEAIEVTVASHEFEQNLEQNQQNLAGEQQEAEARKASRRNINLNSPEGLEGQMTEEENLAAKIMSEQGNRVDLTA